MNKITKRLSMVCLFVLLCLSLCFSVACEDTVAAKYKVTFDTDGGSVAPVVQEIESGKLVVKPDDPVLTAEGYIVVFDGWYNGTEKWDFENSSVSKDVVLKAKYTKTAIEYTSTVKYYAGDDKDLTTDTITYTIENRTDKLAEIASKKLADSAQYAYSWVEALPTELPLENGKTYTVTREIKQYTVTLMKDGAQFATQTVDYNGLVQEPTDSMAKEATAEKTYTFKFWSVDGATAYNFATAVTADLTLNAIYEVNTIIVAPVINSKMFTGSKLVADVQDTDQYTVTANEGGINVGEYIVTLTTKDGFVWDKDNTTEKTLKFEITKADMVVTAPSEKDGLVYTGSSQALVNAGSVTGGTINYSLDNTNWSTEIPTATEVGSYTVYYKVVCDDNYNENTTVSEISVSIAKADIGDDVVTIPTANTLTYNGTAQALVSEGATTIGTLEYKLGEGEFGEAVPTATDAGSYIVSYKVVGNSNYNDKTYTETITVSIAKADIGDDVVTIPTANTLTYNGTAQALVSEGATTIGTLEYKLGEGEFGEAVPTATDAGSYVVSYKVVGNSNYNDKTYTETITVSIAKADIGDDVVTIPTANTLTYNGTAQALVSEGATTIGTLEYKLGEGEFGEAVPTATDAGSYVVSYKVVGNSNYNDKTYTETITVSIAKADIAAETITAPVAINSISDGAAKSLIYAGSCSISGTKMQYKVGDGQYADEIPSVISAGTYNIYYKVVGANYNDSTENCVTALVYNDITLTSFNYSTDTEILMNCSTIDGLQDQTQYPATYIVAKLNGSMFTINNVKYMQTASNGVIDFMITYDTKTAGDVLTFEANSVFFAGTVPYIILNPVTVVYNGSSWALASDFSFDNQTNLLTAAYRYGASNLIQINTNLPSTTTCAPFLATDNGNEITQSGNQQFGWSGMVNADGTIIITMNFNAAFTEGQTYTLGMGSKFVFTNDGVATSYYLDKNYTFTFDGSNWTCTTSGAVQDLNVLEIEYNGFSTPAITQVQYYLGGLMFTYRENVFNAGDVLVVKAGSVIKNNNVGYVLTDDYIVYFDGTNWCEPEETEITALISAGDSLVELEVSLGDIDEALTATYSYGTSELIQIKTNLPSQTYCNSFLTTNYGCEVYQSGNQNIGWISMAKDDAGSIYLAFNFNNKFTEGQTFVLSKGSKFVFSIDGGANFDQIYYVDKTYTFTFDGSSWTCTAPNAEQNMGYIIIECNGEEDTNITSIEYTTGKLILNCAEPYEVGDELTIKAGSIFTYNGVAYILTKDYSFFPAGI